MYGTKIIKGDNTIAERHVERKRFWTALLEVAKTKTKLHSNISPGIYNWIGTSAGIQGLNWNYAVRQHDAQLELYIDRDKDTGEGNKAILDKLQTHSTEIEKSFGAPLLWESLDEKRACRVRYVVDVAGWQDEQKWPEADAALVDAMVKMESSIRPYMKDL